MTCLGDYLESGAAAFTPTKLYCHFEAILLAAARVIVEYHRTIRFASIFGCKPRFSVPRHPAGDLPGCKDRFRSVSKPQAAQPASRTRVIRTGKATEYVSHLHHRISGMLAVAYNTQKWRSFFRAEKFGPTTPPDAKSFFETLIVVGVCALVIYFL